MSVRSASSTSIDPDTVAAELCDGVQLSSPDLAAIWISHHHLGHQEALLASVHARLNPRNLIGCSAQSVIGPETEIEDGPGACLFAASLPGVRVFPFLLDQNDLERLEEPAELHDRLGATPDDIPTFIILPDPFTIQYQACIGLIDQAFNGSTTVGGIASAAREPGKNRLFLGDQSFRQGLVGVTLTGDLRTSTIVSQGCRPIGPTFVITKAKSNVIIQLGGRNAYDVLHDMHDKASASDQARIRGGLHIGRLINEHQDNPGPGDFLIRNIAGIVDNEGLAVTDHLRPGQTVQFHVRDADTAEHELRSLLTAHVEQSNAPPAGALLFNCNGRGSGLFGEPNHDIHLINELLPGTPTAGFFAGGEIGPVGGSTFVHGLTSSLILLDSLPADD